MIFAVIKPLAIISCFLLLFILEKMPHLRLRAMPHLSSRPYLKRCLHNGLLYGLNVLIYPVSAGIALYASQHPLPLRPDFLQGGGFILVDILLLDVMIYGWHRLNHAIPFLWAFHVVHHMDRMMDSTTAVRFHFGEVLLSALNRSIFIIIFAIPFQTVLLMETLLFSIALFHHANISLPEKWDRVLGWFIVTPRIHSVHHHAYQRDTDSNYGNLLSVWDRIFGSYNASRLDGKMRVGVQGQKEELTMAQLLAYPFIHLWRKRD